MSYIFGGDNARGIALASRQISGRSLAHLRKIDKVGRAFLAADIIQGRVQFGNLTVTQIARLLGVSTVYVHLALRASPEERRAIERGYQPLKPPVVKALPSPAHPLVSAWDAAPPEERRALIRARPDAVYQAI